MGRKLVVPEDEFLNEQLQSLLGATTIDEAPEHNDGGGLIELELKKIAERLEKDRPPPTPGVRPRYRDRIPLYDAYRHLANLKQAIASRKTKTAAIEALRLGLNLQELASLTDPAAKIGRKIMNALAGAVCRQNEKTFYDELPDLITAYRGCSTWRKRGLSWTTDRRVAASFAKGHSPVPRSWSKLWH